MSKDITKPEDLTLDPQNANLGTERGAALLGRSLERHGAARSIVVDKNGVVIAGNKTVEEAVAAGIPVTVIKSGGKKLVVVQRMDLDLNDPKTRELAYLDNRASEVGLKWSPEQLENDLARMELGGMFDAKEREAILAALMPDDGEARETSTSLAFDTAGHYFQWKAFLASLEGAGDDTDRLMRWVDQEMATLDAEELPEETI